MSFKNAIKSLISNNPLKKARINKMRSEIKNTSATLLCPNCIGGILFHDLGLQFRSPTVNLMMLQTDFLKFASNTKHYLNSQLEFFKHSDYSCPCAKLDDITIHFTHYKTEENAEQKWIQRSSRIDWDNLFIMLSERDGITKEQIESLQKVKARGIVVFTANKYDLPYTVQIPKYAKDGAVGNVLKQSHVTGKREYEKYFDFVKWFNESNGGDYSVSKFCK